MTVLSCRHAERSEPAPAARQEADPCLSKGGPITTDTTFTYACSPYDLPGGIDVINGATLTLEAGVEVRFHDGDWLEIGATGRPGRLVARGTPERPIVLTSADPEHPENGSWLGVWFHSGTLDGSVLSHAIVEKGGGRNTFLKPPLEQACLTFTGVRRGALAVEDVRLRECKNGGLRVTRSALRLARLTTEKTPLAAVADPASFGSFSDALSGDAPLEVHVQGGELGSDARWVAQRAPVIVDGEVRVAAASGPTLTLLPGLSLRFVKGAGLRVGYGAPGALIAAGTEAARIELAARKPEEGWSGVALGPLAKATSELEFTDLRDASPAAIRVEAAAPGVRIEHADFSANALDLELPCGPGPTLADNEPSGRGKVKRRAHCP
jgi:hypothetical protein